MFKLKSTAWMIPAIAALAVGAQARADQKLFDEYRAKYGRAGMPTIWDFPSERWRYSRSCKHSSGRSGGFQLVRTEAFPIRIVNRVSVNVHTGEPITFRFDSEWGALVEEIDKGTAVYTQVRALSDGDEGPELIMEHLSIEFVNGERKVWTTGYSVCKWKALSNEGKPGGPSMSSVVGPETRVSDSDEVPGSPAHAHRKAPVSGVRDRGAI